VCSSAGLDVSPTNGVIAYPAGLVVFMDKNLFSSVSVWKINQWEFWARFSASHKNYKCYSIISEVNNFMAIFFDFKVDKF
jgi:hypothetical protein